MTNSSRGRSRTLALVSIGLAAAVAGVQYNKTMLRRNELAQRQRDGGASDGQPNLYVSVDRSGGGI